MNEIPEDMPMLEKLVRAVLHRRHPGTAWNDQWIDPSVVDDVRSMLHALREPTKDMEEAGEWYAGSQAGECFTAMIEAILKEQA